MKLQKILKNRKGFTLMELIVVLIIMAILVAALAPSFVNFISRARNESLYADARVGMVAAQVLVTEAGGATLAEINAIVDAASAGANNSFFELIEDDVTNERGFSAVTMDGHRVTGITYTDGTDTVTITPRTP